MAVNILFLVKKTCRRCNGKGQVDHPVWAAFWTEWLAAGNPLSTLEDSSNALWFRLRGYDNPPPPLLPCGVCSGTGSTTGHISLGELSALLDQQKEHRHA